MSRDVIKVLAVADPAVAVYVDKKWNILQSFPAGVQFDVVPWTQYYKTMMDVFAGRTYYDIIMVAGHLWKCDFVEKGYLAPLEFEEEDILPAIVQELKYKDQVYLSPSFCDGHMIVYRKSILEMNLGKGLKTMVTPREYIEAAKLLSKVVNIPAVAMKAHPSEIFTDALPFLRMSGLDVYDGISKEANCGENEIIQGLEAYCDLRKYAAVDTDTYGNDEIATAIKNKKAAMAVTWSGQLGVVYDDACMDKDDLGFASFSTAWNVTWSFAISAKCKNRALANQLLRFLRSPEVDTVAGAFSGAPVRRQSYLAGKEKFPWYSCQLLMIENTRLLPDMVMAGDKNSVLYDEISNAFAGKKTPAQAMTDAKSRINRIGS